MLYSLLRARGAGEGVQALPAERLDIIKQIYWLTRTLSEVSHDEAPPQEDPVRRSLVSGLPSAMVPVPHPGAVLRPREPPLPLSHPHPIPGGLT